MSLSVGGMPRIRTSAANSHVLLREALRSADRTPPSTVSPAETFLPLGMCLEHRFKDIECLSIRPITNGVREQHWVIRRDLAERLMRRECQGQCCLTSLSKKGNQLIKSGRDECGMRSSLRVRCTPGRDCQFLTECQGDAARRDSRQNLLWFLIL